MSIKNNLLHNYGIYPITISSLYPIFPNFPGAWSATCWLGSFRSPGWETQPVVSLMLCWDWPANMLIQTNIWTSYWSNMNLVTKYTPLIRDTWILIAACSLLRRTRRHTWSSCSLRLLDCMPVDWKQMLQGHGIGDSYYVYIDLSPIYQASVGNKHILI